MHQKYVKYAHMSAKSQICTYRVIHLKYPTPQNLTIKIHNLIKNRDKYMKFSGVFAKTTSNLKKKLILKKI